MNSCTAIGTNGPITNSTTLPVAVIDPLSDQPVTEMVDIMAGEAGACTDATIWRVRKLDISPDGRFIAYASKKSSSKLGFCYKQPIPRSICMTGLAM